MLNTSLHNPNVKDKPNLQRFVCMNRGINNGADLPVDLLTVRSLPASELRAKPSCWSLLPSGGAAGTFSPNKHPPSLLCRLQTVSVLPSLTHSLQLHEISTLNSLVAENVPYK